LIALYIILGLVLIIGLLLSISVGIGYKYKNGVFTLYVTVGPVKIKLLPKKRKRFNYKKLAKRLRGRRISDIRFTAKEKQKGGELDLKALFSDLRLDKMIDEISRSTKNPELVKILLLTIKEFVLKFRTKLHTTVRHLIIKVDEKDFGEQDCLFAVIANAPYYGGGFMGAPKAIPNDQKLNFTKVDLIDRLSILKFLPIYKKGEQEKLDCCYMSDCDTLEITSKCDVPVNLDGEIIFTKSIKFEIVKNGLELLLPKKAVNKLLINA